MNKFKQKQASKNFIQPITKILRFENLQNT